MSDLKTKEIVNKIRKGELDCNNQELFFSNIIKGLLLRLDDDISIRNKSVPHFILHTGDDTMYLNVKGYNNSIEPIETSNEDYVYNIIPRCIVNPSAVDLLPDQLTNPYSRGVFQYQHEDSIYTLSAEFRRMPVKLSCEIKYYVDSFKDLLELVQQMVSKLTFIRTYDITYMGQVIKCSYKIPENFQTEHLMDIDGTTMDNKNKILTLSLEIESNYPIFANQAVVSTSDYISNINTSRFNHGLSSSVGSQYPGQGIDKSKYPLGFKLYGTEGIKMNESPTDIIKSSNKH